ncbi:DUF1764-domain-containing protein, partial [Wolfiporia cocos MD-104 SS10]
LPAEKKKKSKSAKRKRAPDRADAVEQPAKKRPVPETVLDPSARVAAPAPRRSKADKAAARAAPDAPVRKKHKADNEDEERFKDSRGTGPRRKTEEGFAIYKEDELGITDQGGDTPLCPFDCQCCF